MKCPNCKKKTTIATQIKCKWCEIVFCIACSHLECHNCDKVEDYKNYTKINLEKKLVKVESQKILNI